MGEAHRGPAVSLQLGEAEARFGPSPCGPRRRGVWLWQYWSSARRRRVRRGERRSSPPEDDSARISAGTVVVMPPRSSASSSPLLRPAWGYSRTWPAWTRARNAPSCRAASIQPFPGQRSWRRASRRVCRRSVCSGSVGGTATSPETGRVPDGNRLRAALVGSVESWRCPLVGWRREGQ